MPAIGDVFDSVRNRLTGHRPARHDGPLPSVPRRPTTNPILAVHDMPQAIDFYRSLGFEVIAYDDGYSWVKHCSWEFLHLRLVGELDPTVNAGSAYIHVDDVDGWHAAFVATSAGDAIGAIVDQPWGLSEFELVDPSGNLVRFGQHR